MKSLQAKGEVILLVGDGVNDAPALAEADVGVAMRGGTGSAMEAADVVLMRDDVRGAGMVVDTSKLTLRKVTNREVITLRTLRKWPQGARIIFPTLFWIIPFDVNARLYCSTYTPNPLLSLSLGVHVW